MNLSQPPPSALVDICAVTPSPPASAANRSTSPGASLRIIGPRQHMALHCSMQILLAASALRGSAGYRMLSLLATKAS